MEFIMAVSLLALLAQSYRMVDLLDDIREATEDRRCDCGKK